MTTEERSLDLTALSTEEKDRVLLGLWADLRDERAKSHALEQRLAEIGGTVIATDDGRSLLEDLRRHGTRKGINSASKGARVRLGRGLGLLEIAGAGSAWSR